MNRTIWWRRLYPQERVFLENFLGAEQAAWLAARVRLGLRRLGDTRRALCLNGGWLSFPRSCYLGGQLHGGLYLTHPLVAGIFAHELLHALQRRHGLPVTRSSAWLQCRHWLGGPDPYAYDCVSSPAAMLRRFWRAQVEQQAQMWQDWVESTVAGTPNTGLCLVAAAVRAGRFQASLCCRLP